MSTPSLRDWRWRAAVCACALVLPFLRFILQNSYPPLRPEVLLIAMSLALLALALGLLVRGSAFYVVMFLLLALTAANAVQAALWPLGRPRHWLLLVTALAIGVPMWAMREVFFRLLVVFTLSVFAVDVGQFAFRTASRHSVSAAALPAAAVPHVVYIVLDEHIGLAGLPEEIPECRRARALVEAVFVAHGFQVYPNAYTNYDSTLPSLSSILNFSILGNYSDFLSLPSPSTISLTQNRLFASLRRRGYSVSVYQPRHPDYCGGPADCTSNVFYPANSISRIEGLRIPTVRKISFIACSYAESYVLVQKAVDRGLLTRLPKRIGPLSLEDVWPGRLAGDIASADRPTLFFAHLLTPHFPYVYRLDGSLRDERRWITGHWDMNGLNPSAYAQRYTEYAGQVEYLAAQTDEFLRRLEKRPLYDRSLIIFHGDHGSRLHRAHSHPDARDLLDGYSALLAVKLPHAKQGRIVPRKVSVLRLVWELLGEGRNPLSEAADDVYSFDSKGRSQRAAGATSLLGPR